MADIRKTFNFRAGVQVDDDVFIVRGEQVGIGTTIPTQSLDVRGNAKVVGILTAQNTDFSAGISTFGDVKIGTGISISASSGIITATSFSGDGSQLQNVPTSSWTQYNQLDDNGLSVVSIAKSTGNVGIATTGASSNNDLQIGSDPQDGFSKGVGIGSDGNIYASGIITATTFRGTLVGTVATVTSNQGNFSDHVSVGNTVSIGGTVGLGSHVNFGDESKAIFGDSEDLQIYHDSINGHSYLKDSGTGNLILQSDNEVEMITFNPPAGGGSEKMLVATKNEGVKLYFDGNQKLNTTSSGVNITGITTTDDLNVSGVSTFTGAIDANGDLNLSGVSTFMNNVMIGGGNLTIDGNIDANGDLDVDGFTNLDGASIDGNLSVSGVSTFTGSIDANGDLDVDGHTELDNVNVSGVITATSFIGNVTGTVNTAAQPNITSLGTITGLDVNGHSELDNVNVSGVSTFTGAIDANGDLDVDGQTELDNVNVSGLSTFTGAIDANGNLDVDGFTNLDGASIDGNLNVSGLSTFVGQSKFDGLVGIQTATPQVQFHVWENDEQVARFQSNQTSAYISFVDQTSTFTPYVGANANALIFGNTSQGELARISGIGSLGIGKTNPEHKLDVVGTSKFTGTINADGGIVVGTAATMNNSGFRGNLTGNLTGDIFKGNGDPLIVGGVLSGNVNSTGISTFNNITAGIITTTSRVAVQTNNFTHETVDIELHSDIYVRGSVAVGSTGHSAVDFSDVVNVPDPTGNRAKAAYMIPPKVTTTQRNALRDTYDALSNTPVVDGALIYNTTTNRLEIRMSGAWYGIGTVA